MLNTAVSAYNNVLDVEAKPTTIGKFVKSVREGKYKDKIEYLRSLDKKAADAYKPSLPGITVSGIFGGTRKSEDIIEPSGFIAMDFDYLDYTILPETKRKLKEDLYSAVVSVSASGRGLFVIVKIDTDISKYRDYFEALTKYYKQKYNLTADPATKNISRLRFVSYDPDIYVNEESQEFPLLEIEYTDKDMPTRFYGEHPDISFGFGENIVPEACNTIQIVVLRPQPQKVAATMDSKRLPVLKRYIRVLKKLQGYF